MPKTWFKIAEKDLKLRGAGDVLGIRQSGVVDFKIADAFGAEAIIDTYKRAKSEWHFSVEYMAELVLSLYWAITTNIKFASLYYDLWQDCHKFCCSHFTGDDLTKYNKLIESV